MCALCVCACAWVMCCFKTLRKRKLPSCTHTLTATWFDQRGHLVRKRQPPRKHTHAHAVRLTPRVADGASTYTRTITHESHEPTWVTRDPPPTSFHHETHTHTHTHTHTPHDETHAHTHTCNCTTPTGRAASKVLVPAACKPGVVCAGETKVVGMVQCRCSTWCVRGGASSRRCPTTYPHVHTQTTRTWLGHSRPAADIIPPSPPRSSRNTHTHA